MNKRLALVIGGGDVDPELLRQFFRRGPEVPVSGAALSGVQGADPVPDASFTEKPCGGADVSFTAKSCGVPEFVIAADAGLLAAKSCGVPVTHIVGDFDSTDQQVLAAYMRDPSVEIHRFRPEKDNTDTEIALELAIRLGAQRVVLLGCTGTRLDHVWGSVQLLHPAKEKGVEAVILDRHNRISAPASGTTLRRDRQYGKYVSFFSLGDAVEGLCLTGFKYPLQNHTLTPDGSLSVSNEIAGETAIVRYRSGRLIMMETRD